MANYYSHPIENSTNNDNDNSIFGDIWSGISQAYNYFDETPWFNQYKEVNAGVPYLDNSMGLSPDIVAKTNAAGPYNTKYAQQTAGGILGIDNPFGDQGIFGDMEIGDWANVAQIGTGLFDSYMGYKGYGLAKDSLNHRKAFDWANLSNQVATVNNNMYDRERIRYRQGGMSEDEASSRADAYVKQHGLKDGKRYA